MTTNQEVKSPATRKKQEAGLLEAVVCDSVLSSLGEPGGLHRVRATRVLDDNYRVNVFAGPNIASFKIVHSYFLKADSNGKILTSFPAITRVY